MDLACLAYKHGNDLIWSMKRTTLDEASRYAHTQYFVAFQSHIITEHALWAYIQWISNTHTHTSSYILFVLACQLELSDLVCGLVSNATEKIEKRREEKKLSRPLISSLVPFFGSIKQTSALMKPSPELGAPFPSSPTFCCLARGTPTWPRRRLSEGFSLVPEFDMNSNGELRAIIGVVLFYFFARLFYMIREHRTNMIECYERERERERNLRNADAICNWFHWVQFSLV